jgi:hypothetical protein
MLDSDSRFSIIYSLGMYLKFPSYDAKYLGDEELGVVK